MIYKIIYNLTSWLIPSKEKRREYKNYLIQSFIDKNIKPTQNRYIETIKKLKQKIKKDKIKVVFLNSDCSKWAYQSIYEEFNKDSRFEPLVLVAVNKLLQKKKFEWLNWEKSAMDNYEFFKGLGLNVDLTYDFKLKKEIDIKKFKPDIIFYDEMYERTKNQHPIETSKYALNMCCSYGSCISNGINEYNPIYKLMYTYFVDNSYIEKLLIKKGFDERHIKFAGHPKIDEYRKPVNPNNTIWKSDKKRIIYAPHYSFFKSSALKYGTFLWSGKFLYDFALSHKEYEFIIKPHPQLKRHLVNRKIMSIDEVNKYFNNWNKLENAQVYEKGAYFDMFRTSDLLITDCNSFLFEYLPTLKPVIHLVSENSIGHNEFGQEIIKGYYSAHNTEELSKYLYDILVLNLDKKANIRKDIIENNINLGQMPSSKIIKDYVSGLINEE